jgi:hypothetical protein
VLLMVNETTSHAGTCRASRRVYEIGEVKRVYERR